MPWKDEREPTIKYCLGRQVDVVQEFTIIQNFGQNWWWATGIRVEYLNRIHTLQLCNTVKSSCQNRARSQNNLQDGSSSCRCSTTSLGSQDNEQESELSANLVSIYAKRFSPGRWSFLGPGSEKKWYSTHDSKPQGEWDRVAELMMVKFGESGHPVFRATSPLSRGMLKSRGGGKLSIHFCADGERLKLFFAQLFLLISSVSTEQSQICVKHTKPAM